MKRLFCMRGIRAKQARPDRGVLTVEAAIVLPVFISVVISVAFFMRVIYVHELMQHAITDAANEMASTSYVLYMTGVSEIGGSPINQPDGESIEDNALDLLRAFIEDGQEVDMSGGANTGNVASTEEELNNALDKLECFINFEGEQDIKNAVMSPIFKFYLDKHLRTERYSSGAERLESLNIHSLDFSDSKFYYSGAEYYPESRNDIITIEVAYIIDLPVPIPVIDEIPMGNKVTVRAWLGGVE